MVRTEATVKEEKLQNAEAQNFKVSADPPSTPAKRTHNQSTDISPPVSPSIKRERGDSTPSSPSKNNLGSKWADWEDKIILDEVISIAEKGIDWHAVTQRLNERREDQGPRTVNGVKLHWRTQKIKLTRQ